jgi:hypothetical protein
MFAVILKIKNVYFLKQPETFGFVIETLCVVSDVRNWIFNPYPANVENMVSS